MVAQIDGTRPGRDGRAVRCRPWGGRHMPIYAATPGALSLAGVGMLLPIVVSAGDGRAQVVTAQVDTGSDVSSVDDGLLRGLGADVIGSAQISTVDGTTEVSVYDVDLSTPAGVSLTAGLPGGVLGDSLPYGVRCLIGRDVLARLVLQYSGPDGAWSIDAPQALPLGPQYGLSPFWATVWASVIGGGVLLGIAEVQRRGGLRMAAPQPGRRRIV
jgi:hypothetical protein